MASQHPFQCLATAKPPRADATYLLAACGPKIVSIGLGGDTNLFEWTAGAAAVPTKPEYEGRPAKKQKTSSPSSPNVIKLTVSPDNHHAVAVTEDKLVRVFEVLEDGMLAELSQRAMPKRPCAVEVLPDNATILCGDKFGDVYSLPLLPKELLNDGDSHADIQPNKIEEQPQPFRPSASSTTVHTKRNRKALEAQLKQKNLTPKSKEPLKFEHSLLLGHVSMLTDMAYASREVAGQHRGYIITADRDEHIRVSRRPPQSHVIEGYCLGHKNFVSKVCLVPSTDLLVSGGGDDWIGVWEWPSYKLKNKIDILEAVREAVKDRGGRLGQSGPAIENVNVSGIWTVPMKVGELITNDKPVTEPAVVVTCDGVSAMLVCPATDLLANNAKFQSFTTFDAPLLDMTCFEAIGIVAFDDRENAEKRMMSFRLERDKNSATDAVSFFGDVELFEPLQRLNALEAGVENEKALDGLLYGVANLRKRGYQNEEEGGDVVEEADGGD